MLISLHITHSSAGGMTSLGDIIPALNDTSNAELPKCDYCDEYLAEVFKVGIGKPTGDAMMAVGMPADAFPEKSTFEGMLQLVKERFEESD